MLYVFFMVTLGLILTEIPLKVVRLFIDRQQGKNDLTINMIECGYGMDLAKEIRCFRETLENQGRFVTWPRLINFFDDWFAEDIHDETVFLPNTLWYRRRHSDRGISHCQARRLLIFVHGGGMIAGSPLKYNSLNWITTVAWLGGRHQLYTDLLSLDYRLSPEHEAPGALLDCLKQIGEVCTRIKASGNIGSANIERIHLIGFSAGALLALQMTLMLEYAQKNPLASTVFEVVVDDKMQSLANTIYDGTTQFDLYLCSPITRLDRLFLNRHTDVSATLGLFTKIFTRHAQYQDPLYVMQKHRLCLDCPASIRLIDVSCNSLSNHTIQLAGYLDLISHQRFSAMILDKHFFKVEQALVNKIKLFNKHRGLKTPKFLRNLERKHQQNSQFINSIHSHFFMFIVPVEAAWLTLKSILGVLGSLPR